MRRTQIYITDDQDQRVGELAKDLAVSKAEVIRRILDQALEIDAGEREAAGVIAATAGLLAGYPDWPEWLGDVRGRSAAERVGSLGL